MVLGGEQIKTVRAIEGHLVGTNSKNQPIPPNGWAGATMTAVNLSSTVQYRLLIKSVEPVSADPSDVWWQGIDRAGTLYFYDVRYQKGNNWVSFCQPDMYGETHAIPLPIYYDDHGVQHSLDNPYAPLSALKPPPTFAWACSSGVSSKAVKWGYFPWLRPDSASLDQMRQVHWAVTRAARADYCGDGNSHTYDNTLVRLWDNVTPNPIWTNPDAPNGIVAGSSGVFRANLTATTADAPPQLYFEAAWSTEGATCLSKLRYDSLPPHTCPGPPPFGSVDWPGYYRCDSQAEAEGGLDIVHYPLTSPRIFNQSAINPIPPTNPVGPVHPVGPIGPISAVGSLVK